MADHRADRVSGDEYMSAWEFARLPSDVHHAVWAARDIDSIPVGGLRCYRRDQVLALLGELEAAR